MNFNLLFNLKNSVAFDDHIVSVYDCQNTSQIELKIIVTNNFPRQSLSLKNCKVDV